jgi:hypothetical protein
MNVHLTYHSGQSYSEHLSNFDVKVSVNSGKRVKVSFREKQPPLTYHTGQKSSERGEEGYAAFSLPVDKARQLAHAILTASEGDVKAIEFAVEESVKTKVVAA